MSTNAERQAKYRKKNRAAFLRFTVQTKLINEALKEGIILTPRLRKNLERSKQFLFKHGVEV